MTDYNDGKWHGWNGGECPVHPDAEVEPVWIDGRTGKSHLRFKASVISWSGRFDVPVAFRVTKPAPPKPRERWIIEFGYRDDDVCRVVRDSADAAEREAASLRNQWKHVSVIPVIEKLP